MTKPPQRDPRRSLELLEAIAQAAAEGRFLRSSDQPQLTRELVLLRDEGLIKVRDRSSWDDPHAMDVLDLTAAGLAWMTEERARLRAPIRYWLARNWRWVVTTLIAVAVFGVALAALLTAGATPTWSS